LGLARRHLPNHSAGGAASWETFRSLRVACELVGH